MVHRRLGGAAPRALPLALVALALGRARLAAAAAADNTRVSISNYEWSNQEVHINLGEKVTWDWLGPDLAALGDRDLAERPAVGLRPRHRRPRATAPATNTRSSSTSRAPTSSSASCTPSSAARWSSPTPPANPNSDPGPQPPLNIDLTPPTLGDVTLQQDRAAAAPRASQMKASISERGTLDAEYYRLDSKGQPRLQRLPRTGTTFIGINQLPAGARWKHFKAPPGPLRRGAAGDRRIEQRLQAGDQGASRSSAPPPATRRGVSGARGR